MLTAPTVTGWSGFWNMTGGYNTTGGTYSMSQSQGRYKFSKLVAKEFKKMGARDAQGALVALIGAAPGGTATNTWPQVPVPTGPNSNPPQVTGIADFGGNRNAVTVTAINRATTAADDTELTKWFTTALLEQGITYPAKLGSSVMNGTMHQGTPGFA
jgi:hypothetical protein